jgi:putative ABC transport system permease protein
MQLYAVNPGFDLANVLTLQAPTDFANSGFTAQIRERQMQFTRNMVDKVKDETPVQSAAMASAAPLAGSFPIRREISVDGTDSDASASAPVVVTRIVSGSYFETVGTRLKAGRTFATTDAQDAPLVTILSESMSKYYFKNDDPIGKRIRLKGGNGLWGPPIEVVGIAADSRADGVDHAPMHTMYQPDSQAGPQSTLLVRTAASSKMLAPQIIEKIRALDPNRPSTMFKHSKKSVMKPLPRSD